MYLTKIVLHRVWSTYQPKLKSLKELRLRKKSEQKLEKAERLKERCRAAIIIQKYWRGYKYVVIYTYIRS